MKAGHRESTSPSWLERRDHPRLRVRCRCLTWSMARTDQRGLHFFLSRLSRASSFQEPHTLALLTPIFPLCMGMRSSSLPLSSKTMIRQDMDQRHRYAIGGCTQASRLFRAKGYWRCGARYPVKPQEPLVSTACEFARSHRSGSMSCPAFTHEGSHYLFNQLVAHRVGLTMLGQAVALLAKGPPEAARRLRPQRVLRTGAQEAARWLATVAR